MKPGNWTIASYNRGIGDDIMLSGVARELRRQGHAARITIVTRYPSLFYRNPDVHRVVFNNAWPGQGCRRRVYHFLRRRNLARKLFLPFYPCPLNDMHPLQYHYRDIGLDANAAEVRSEIFLSPDEIMTARRLLGTGTWIGLHSTGKLRYTANKNWGAERFRRLCRLFQSKGYNVVQLGRAEDPPSAATLDLRGKTTLRQAAAVIAVCTMSVFQEGGLSHMSHAVATPCVVVCGGFSGRNWLYPGQVFAGADMECAPCNNPAPCPKQVACMDMITPEGVFELSADLLASLQKPRITRPCVTASMRADCLPREVIVRGPAEPAASAGRYDSTGSGRP